MSSFVPVDQKSKLERSWVAVRSRAGVGSCEGGRHLGKKSGLKSPRDGFMKQLTASHEVKNESLSLFTASHLAEGSGLRPDVLGQLGLSFQLRPIGRRSAGK